MSDMASTPPAASPSADGNTGPLGETRSIGLSILWFILTLGIYGIYWVYKTFEEMKRHTGQGIGGVLAIVIHLVIGVVLWFVAPSEVGAMYKRDGRPAPVSGWAGLWWLLPIVGWFIWFFKVQGNLNRYWESKGAAA
jgi:amino acid transporter